MYISYLVLFNSLVFFVCKIWQTFLKKPPWLVKYVCAEWKQAYLNLSELLVEMQNMKNTKVYTLSTTRTHINCWLVNTFMQYESLFQCTDTDRVTVKHRYMKPSCGQNKNVFKESFSSCSLNPIRKGWMYFSYLKSPPISNKALRYCKMESLVLTTHICPIRLTNCRYDFGIYMEFLDAALKYISM